MNIQIHHNNIEVSEGQEAYITGKIENIKKYERRIADEATVVRVDIEKNKVKTSKEHITLHITLVVPHSVIRAEVNAVTVEEATDKAIDKLKRQIERYKTKKHRRNNNGEWIPESTLENITSSTQQEYEVGSLSVVKRKTFSNIKPMHEDEAVEQMELLGHDFFAFLNADTHMFSILYRRAGDEAGYGLIELDTQSV